MLMADEGSVHLAIPPPDTGKLGMNFSQLEPIKVFRRYIWTLKLNYNKGFFKSTIFNDF